MNNQSPSRMGAACGAIFAIVLTVASGSGSSAPTRASLVAGLAALALALPFLCYLCVLLRDAQGARGWLASTALAAGVAWVAIKLASGAPEIALLQVPAGSTVYRALQDVADGATVISLYPLAICCAAVAVTAFQTRALPRWLAAGAGVTAVAAAINGGLVTTDSVPAMLVFVLWTLVASVYLVIRGSRRTASPAPAPAGGTLTRAN
jgi:hypothetical protein